MVVAAVNSTDKATSCTREDWENGKITFFLDEDRQNTKIFMWLTWPNCIADKCGCVQLLFATNSFVIELPYTEEI